MQHLVPQMLAALHQENLCARTSPRRGERFFTQPFPWLSANTACTGFVAKQVEGSGRPVKPELSVLISHCAVLSKEWTGTGHQNVLSGLLQATSNN